MSNMENPKWGDPKATYTAGRGFKPPSQSSGFNPPPVSVDSESLTTPSKYGVNPVALDRGDPRGDKNYGNLKRFKTFTPKTTAHGLPYVAGPGRDSFIAPLSPLGNIEVPDMEGY